MHEWLERAAARLDVGDLTAEDQHALLDLARVAAHASGDRRNAPLVTYLVGMARARHPERSVAELTAELGEL